MAGSVNKVILIGNLGADPEIRRTQDGRPIANLRIATSETWRDKTSGGAQGKDRVAPRRHLQRGALQDRRAVLEERLQGLSGGRLADPQMAGPVGRGPLFTRGRAAGLQFAAHHAGPGPGVAAAAISRARETRGRLRRLGSWRAAQSPPWRAPVPLPVVVAAGAAISMTRFRSDGPRAAAGAAALLAGALISAAAPGGAPGRLPGGADGLSPCRGSRRRA